MFLNIDVSLQGGGDNTADKTATESKIDREELFSFLLMISEEVFGLLKFTIDTIFALRYTTKQNSVVINPPVSFDIRSVNELTTEITQAQSTNAPDIIKRELTKEYMALRFSAQKNLDKLLDVIFYCDALAGKTTQEVVLLRTQGLISAIDAVLHVNIFHFIEQKLSTNPNYLTTDTAQIRTELLEMAAEKAQAL